MTKQTPRTGRCQHCQQIRPLWRHEGQLQFWGYDPGEAAWLCARDYSAREVAVERDEPFHIEHDLIAFPEDRPAQARFYGPDGTELTASAR
ncbi:hypothetical protein ACFWEV_35060 [Streptomyces bacillaris]|uniref:hypothetical protein n=1 Tax=Streptomyces bacillaris TaxID=68179 RepID=UPI00366567CA